MNFCHLEAWLDGQWQTIATVTAERGSSQQPVAITYVTAHALAHLDETGPAALSVTLPVTLRTHHFDSWPGFLCDLLPQGEGRRRLSAHLGLANTASSDWQLLVHGAGNPIGHLRVREAAQWLAQQPRAPRAWTLDDLSQRDDSFLDALQMQGLGQGGTTGVQGEWPKVLLTRDAEARWHLDHELADAHAQQHLLVKLARRDDPVFDLILRGEAACHAVAGELGASTEGEVRYHQGLLLIDRFDRQRTPSHRVKRVAQESLYSACGQPGFDSRLTHPAACRRLRDLCSEGEAAVLEYIWRDILNLALGNRDNHGRNTALQRLDDGCIRLAPVFDLAPMQLHPEGIARRMRWYPDEQAQPDWRRVATLLAEAEILPEHRLADMLPAWLTRLADLEARLAARGCPEAVIARTRPGRERLLRRLEEAC